MISDMHKPASALPSSFVAAMRHFFGYKDGQTLTGFKDEINALSPADREYFRLGLNSIGYNFSAAA